MKHSILMKFLVVLLTAICFVAAIGGGAGIVALESSGLYVNDLGSLQDQEYNSISSAIAGSYARRYAVETLSNLPYIMREELYADPENRSDAEHWTICIQQGDQLLVAPGSTAGCSIVKQYTLAPLYPLVSEYGPSAEPEDPEDPTGSSDAAEGDSSESDKLVPQDYLYYEQDTRWNGSGFTTQYMYYYQAPEYQVTVYMRPDVLENSSLHLLTDIFPYRYGFIAILILGMILSCAGICYLCWSAGRTKDGVIRPGGLNLLPLDLYAISSGFAVWMLWQLYQDVINWVNNEGPHAGNLSLAGVNLMAIAIICLGFLCAVSAQLKQPSFYWWRHSALGWCLAKLFRGIRFLWRGCVSLVQLLPMIWQWVLIVCLMAAGILICAIFAGSSGWALALLIGAILICCGTALYCGYAIGILIRGIRRMNQGDLSYQISTRYLLGYFRTLALELNSLSETAMIAAEHEMRSERMKSELITNVSHDIKTPLTSIINFVDLLRKPHSAQQSEEYLDVLSRQSARMKKLIEDLVELSKASSGNTTVNITTIDIAESVNQALGEFSDKLSSARLESVFRQPDAPVHVCADGRLTWRVLSNLLSNAVKYAMPDTRLYIDLVQAEDSVLLSIKNISRQELNIDADTLLERFVRGDVSRNSEGSGLGLNIAKNLMELQGGQLQLLLDGDLFKVTLVFPGAQSDC